MSLSRLLATVYIALHSTIAFAQVECGGKLTQEHFSDNIKQLNQEIQANIDEYRKTETQSKQAAPGSPELSAAKQKMSEINARVTKQRETFKELNSPLFPATTVSVYGAACTDRRWITKGKEVLVQNPKMLGQNFHVWMDAKTREYKGGLTRPKLDEIAK